MTNSAALATGMQRVTSFGEMLGLAVLGIIATPKPGFDDTTDADDSLATRILRFSPPVDLML